MARDVMKNWLLENDGSNSFKNVFHLESEDE